MRKVVTDYDGVLLSTEFGKSAMWYLTAMNIIRDPEITNEFIEGIIQELPEAKEEFLRLVEERKNDIRRAMKHAGGSATEVAAGVFQEFVSEEFFSCELDKTKIEEIMVRPGKRMEDILVKWVAKPLFGNLSFFSFLSNQMKAVYKDAHPIGLVTLSKAYQIKGHLELEGEDGHSLWRDFKRLAHSIFKLSECAGDYKDKFTLIAKASQQRKISKKTIAYRVLCARLGLRPEETITFEDTVSGISAAKRAGLTCIGVQEFEGCQDLSKSEADLFIVGGLDQLMDLTEVFVWANPKEIIEELRLLSLTHEAKALVTID